MITAGLFLLLFLFINFVPPAALGEETIRVAVPLFPTVAFPLFVANQKGFFQKEQLAVEIVHINSAPTTYQALISGDIHVAAGAPSGLVQVRLQGIDVIALGSWDNFVPYVWATRGKIDDLAQLRGKKVGVNRVGSKPWLIVQVMLQDAGLDPAKDLTLLQIGGGSQERMAALKRGRIDAAPVDYSLEPILKKMGFFIFKGRSTPFMSAPLAVERSYLEAHRPALKRFVKGFLDGTQFILSDKAGTFPVLSRVMRSEDKEVLESAYNYMRARAEPTLYPPESAIKNLLKMAAYLDPRAASVRPETITDFSILEELGQKNAQPHQR